MDHQLCCIQMRCVQVLTYLNLALVLHNFISKIFAVDGKASRGTQDQLENLGTG